MYAFGPTDDTGCTNDPIDITTIDFATQYSVTYPEEGNLPQIFNQIILDFNVTPPEVFYIVGTDFNAPYQELFDELKLIFDSLETI